MLSTSDSFVPAFMSTVLPIAENPPTLYTTNAHHSIQKRFTKVEQKSINLIENAHLRARSPFPEPIRKSTSSSFTPDSEFYQQALGSEREDRQMIKSVIRNVHLHASSPLPEQVRKRRSSFTSSSFTPDSKCYKRALGSERKDPQMQIKSVFENVPLHPSRPLFKPKMTFTPDSGYSEGALGSEWESPPMTKSVFEIDHLHASAPLPDTTRKRRSSSTSGRFNHRTFESKRKVPQMIKLQQQLKSIDSD